MDLRVTGAEQLGDVAKALRQAGRKDLRLELLRSIRAAGKPVIADLRTSARSTLPARGGLAALVARSRYATRTRASGKSAGVRIQATSSLKHDIEAMDRGVLRHPVFGRDRWVTQSVSPGWFTRPVEKSATAMRQAVVDAVADVAAKVERSV